MLTPKCSIKYKRRACFSFVFLFFFSCSIYSQPIISVCSWNLHDFGKSKSNGEIELIADIIKGFDVIAIQEVVAGDGGSYAVSRLSDALNLKGSKWDYIISDPTSSNNGHKVERYAFLWKTSRLKKVGDAWLEKKFHLEIEREPFYITLASQGKKFTLVNFHAIPKSKQPETEIKYFKFLPAFYSSHNLLFVGDFNVPQSHTVFNPLRKMGYTSAMIGQKTSLRQTCLNNDCLASELDNFFFKRSIFKYNNSGIVPFYQAFDDHKKARMLSDHVPIFF